MKIEINSLPYSFAREFNFPITVEAVRTEFGDYRVQGNDFQGQKFKFKQKLDRRFREHWWWVAQSRVTKEVHDV